MTKYMFYLTEREEDEVLKFFESVPTYPEILKNEFVHNLKQKIEKRGLK